MERPKSGLDEAGYGWCRPTAVVLGGHRRRLLDAIAMLAALELSEALVLNLDPYGKIRLNL
jgi:hypothetical protein